MSREKKILSVILVAAFLLSISYSFYFKIQPAVDAKAYDNIAWDIAQGKGYEKNSSIGRPGPGYELFLALIYFIFGHSYAAVWIIHALLFAATAYFVLLTSRLIFQSRWNPIIGMAASAFVAFSPDLITVASMLMTETFFLFLLSISVYAFFKYWDVNKFFWLAVSASLLAGAVLTRSNVLLVILPMVIFLAYKKKWLPLLGFLAVFLLCLIPWTVRNYRIYGEFRPFNAAFGLLYVGNHPGATGELVPNYPLPDGYGDFSKMTQIENDKALRRAGLDYIKTHPLQFIKLSLERASMYFSFGRPFAFWDHLKGVSKIITMVFSSLYSALIFVLGFGGIVLAMGRESGFKREKILLILTMILMMPLSIIFLVVETRYRFPSYPLLAVFSGFSVYCFFKERKVIFQEVKTLLVVLILFIGNTLFDILKNWSRVLERL